MIKRPVFFLLYFLPFFLLADPPALPRPSRKAGFLFPIKPGQPASLTGNMGEIRANHFHGGLDIRTGWASRQPVLAAKDGYVSRVEMKGESYGNTVFLTHPDGYVTLYAHLDRLSEPLHSAVKKAQYAQKAFEVELDFPPGQFSFKQGEVLAISGNTGSSRGPHLHFEIRDTSGMVYNPLSFGFEEVTDNLAPVVDKIAAVPLDAEARVEGIFDRAEVSVRPAGSTFIAARTLDVSGSIGLEIRARDRINNGTSNGGIFCIEIFRDGKLIYYHNMSQFPFRKSNHVNQLINYRHFRLKAEKFQKLYCPDGYFQTRHTPLAQHGRIKLLTGEKANLEIVLWDVHGNKSTAKLNLIGKEPSPLPRSSGKRGTSIRHEILDNILLMKCNGDAGKTNQLGIFQKGRKTIINPSYLQQGNMVFLYDLRNGLPDSAVADERCRKHFSFTGTFFPEQTSSASLPGIGITFPEDCLFDTLYLETTKDEKGIYRLNSSLTPLAAPCTLSFPAKVGIRPENQVACAEALSGVFTKYLPGEIRDDNVFVESKYLGRFRMQTDSVPPVIRPGRMNDASVRFDVFDNLSGIDSFEGSINGEWILMVYDKKRNLLYSEPWPSQLPLRGEFQLKVKDKAGNERIYRRNL